MNENTNAHEVPQIESEKPNDIDSENLPSHEINIHREEFKAMVASISPENSLANKLTTEHIDKYLDNSKIAMEKEYEDRKHRRVWNSIRLVLILAVIIVIAVLMRDNPSEMRSTIAVLTAIAGAVFGGYGYGKSKNRDDQDDED